MPQEDENTAHIYVRNTCASGYTRGILRLAWHWAFRLLAFVVRSQPEKETSKKMPEDIEEITPETPAEMPVETRISEVENTAEIAISIADEQSARITQLEERIAALLLRLDEIESGLSDVRTDARVSVDNPAEETRPAAEEPPIIRPKREHPYYRKLW